MKKYLLILFICLIFGVQNVSAATITSAKYENGLITLSGTGTKQVQIVLFDKDSNPVYMGTAPVVNGKYTVTLPKIANLSDGKYVVKTADYDGQNVANEDITISTSIKNNPNTNDNILLFVSIGLISLTGIVGVAIYINRKKKIIKS